VRQPDRRSGDPLETGLAHLNATAARLNAIASRDPGAVDAIVRLVEESVGAVVPGATGVVYVAERAPDDGREAMVAHAGEASDTQRQVARKEDELACCADAGLLISSRTRLEDTLEAILEMALEVTGARYGIFRLVDRSGENLVMRAIAGDRLGQPAVEALPINATSVMGLVAKTRQPVNICDVYASRPGRASITRSTTRSRCARNSPCR
jgi:hypothetical protein